MFYSDRELKHTGFYEWKKLFFPLTPFMNPPERARPVRLSTASALTFLTTWTSAVSRSLQTPLSAACLSPAPEPN